MNYAKYEKKKRRRKRIVLTLIHIIKYVAYHSSIKKAVLCVIDLK